MVEGRPEDRPDGPEALKTPAEYREHAEAKRKARKESQEEKKQLRMAARRQMTEEERKEEAEKDRARTERLEAAHAELRTRRQEQIAAIAKQLGWADAEWKFDATKERLEKAGAEKDRILKLEAAHHARVYHKAQDALAATKRQLLADPEQARAVLGGLPVTTQDPEKLGLTDLLEPPKTPTGKGYQSTTKPASDEEIRAAVARADVERLREDVALAEEHAHVSEDDGSLTEAVGRLKDLRGELHMAELLQQAATMKPAEVEAARAEVTQATAAVKAEQQTYQARLGELRTAYRETKEAGGRVPEELTALEERAYRDTTRLATLPDKTMEMLRQATALLRGLRDRM